MTTKCASWKLALFSALLFARCSNYTKVLTPTVDANARNVQIEETVVVGNYYKIYPNDRKPFSGKVTAVFNHEIYGVMPEFATNL